MNNKKYEILEGHTAAEIKLWRGGFILGVGGGLEEASLSAGGRVGTNFPKHHLTERTRYLQPFTQYSHFYDSFKSPNYEYCIL